MIESPRLAGVARSRASDGPPRAPEERCELCGAPIPEEHRHVADVQNRSLLCACRACAILLGRDGAGGGHYTLVPERRVALDSFRLDDEQWATLGIPVGLAFFFRSTPAGQVAALYPSPVGATESQLELESWEEIERANPVLGELQDDVEALLVNRVGAAREHFIVPIDDCYSLVALMRSRWQGLTGGHEAWQEIGGFFERLRAQAEREA